MMDWSSRPSTYRSGNDTLDTRQYQIGGSRVRCTSKDTSGNANMNMTLAATVLAALPFTAVDKTTTDTTFRHLAGKELRETIQKGMTPDALYSQVLLAKHDTYQIHMTARDKSGGAEIHDNWSDHIFIEEGEASFVIGGVAVD